MAFDLDKMCKHATERINKSINASAKKHMQAITDGFQGVQRVTLTIRDREHFYKVVTWCNRHIGHGKECWTVRSSVLRYVDPSKAKYNPPAIKEWVIFTRDADITPITVM
jgi:hypothetical protein